MMLIMALPLLGIALFFFLPWRTALPIYLAGVVLSAFYHRAMMKAQRRRVTTGREGMVGTTARVVSWSGTRGIVHCNGETWQARGEGGAALIPGTEATIVGVEHLELVVRPAAVAEDAGLDEDRPAPP